MFKKIFGIIICLAITAIYSSVYAHGTFTWFGLRKDNTEIYINTGAHPEPPHPACDHHPKKPKHKPPKPKHEPHKKGPKHHRCFWWCK